MLSYRHSYHAGNFADVLKHIVQVAIIEYLKKKDKPFTVHDTHAGAGRYAIASEHMQKTGEYQDGIAKLFGKRTGFGVIDQYVSLVEKLNPVGRLTDYPGSPLISARLLREQDVLQCTELHTTDFALLKREFADDKRVQVLKEDAWQGLKALLPPQHRRGLVLIRPTRWKRITTACCLRCKWPWRNLPPPPMPSGTRCWTATAQKALFAVS